MSTTCIAHSGLYFPVKLSYEWPCSDNECDGETLAMDNFWAKHKDGSTGFICEKHASWYLRNGPHKSWLFQSIEKIWRTR